MPLAQRRNRKRQHVQTEIQILAKTPGLDGRGQVHVRQRNKTCFDLLRFRAAQPFERPLLQHAQKLALRIRRKRGDFIQDNRSVPAQFKAPQLPFHRPGERAALVPKQFAFHQLRRQARAIDFQVRRVAPRPQLMNQPCQVVLPRAALSGNQKRSGGSCHFLGKFQQAQRCRVFPNPRQSLVGHVPERRPCPRPDRRPGE